MHGRDSVIAAQAACSQIRGDASTDTPRLFSWLLDLQFVLVSFVVMGGAVWADTRPVKQLLFLLVTPLLAACALWMASTRRGCCIRLRWFDVAGALFVVWAFLTITFAARPWAAVAPGAELLGLYVVFLTVRSAPYTLDTLRGRYVAVYACGALVALFAIVQYFLPQDLVHNPVFHPYVNNRVQSTMGNPNFLASYLNLCFFACIAFACAGLATRPARIAAVCASVLMLAAIMLSRSRTGAAGLLVGAFVFSACYLLRRRFSNRRHVLLVAALLMALLALSGYVIVSRSIGWDGRVQFVDPPRKLMWSTTMRMIRQRPLAGFGLGQYWVTFPLFKQPSEQGAASDSLLVDHAHCELLEQTAETGIVGSVLLIAAVALFFRSLLRRANHPSADYAGRVLAIGGLAGLSAVLVQSLVCVNTRWIQVSYPAVLIAALSDVAARDRNVPLRVRDYALPRALRPAVRVAVPLLLLAWSFLLVPALWRVLLSARYESKGRVLMFEAERTRDVRMVLAAKSLFVASVRENRRNIDGWYGLAQCWAVLDRPDDSLRACDAVSDLCPNYLGTRALIEANYARMRKRRVPAMNPSSVAPLVSHGPLALPPEAHAPRPTAAEP